MYRLLQLSDVHFGAKHAFQQEGRPREMRTFSAAVLQALQDNGLEPRFDAILVTGDVFTDREAYELAEARIQLTALRDALHAEELVIVPGNHDVDRDAAPADKLHIYNRLFDELDAVGRSDEMPIITVVERPPLKPLAVISLDSCRIEGQIQGGLGCVGDPQLDALVARLSEKDVTAETHTLVAVLHHHLLPVAAVPLLPEDDDERLKISATVDASQLLTRLGELGVVAILHGHQHIGTAINYGRMRWRRPDLQIVAAGSAGLRGDDLRRQFWVWELDDEHAEITSLIQHHEDARRFAIETEMSGRLDFGCSD